MRSEAVNRSQIQSQKTVPLLYGEHKIAKNNRPSKKQDPQEQGIPDQKSCLDYFCCCFPCLKKYVGGADDTTRTNTKKKKKKDFKFEKLKYPGWQSFLIMELIKYRDESHTHNWWVDDTIEFLIKHSGPDHIPDF